MVKLVDTPALEAGAQAWEFESLCGHHSEKSLFFLNSINRDEPELSLQVFPILKLTWANFKPSNVSFVEADYFRFH